MLILVHFDLCVRSNLGFGRPILYFKLHNKEINAYFWIYANNTQNNTLLEAACVYSNLPKT